MVYQKGWKIESFEKNIENKKYGNREKKVESYKNYSRNYLAPTPGEKVKLVENNKLEDSRESKKL